jgi:hypothetical protein
MLLPFSLVLLGVSLRQKASRAVSKKTDRSGGLTQLSIRAIEADSPHGTGPLSIP